MITEMREYKRIKAAKTRKMVLVDFYGELKSFSVAEIENFHKAIYRSPPDIDLLEKSAEPNIMFIFKHEGFSYGRLASKEDGGLHIVQGKIAENGYYVN